MNLKTTTLNGKIVDIISEDKYLQKQSMYQNNPQLYNSTAIEICDDGKDYIVILVLAYTHQDPFILLEFLMMINLNQNTPQRILILLILMIFQQ